MADKPTRNGAKRVRVRRAPKTERRREQATYLLDDGAVDLLNVRWHDKRRSVYIPSTWRTRPLTGVSCGAAGRRARLRRRLLHRARSHQPGVYPNRVSQHAFNDIKHLLTLAFSDSFTGVLFFLLGGILVLLGLSSSVLSLSVRSISSTGRCARCG